MTPLLHRFVASEELAVNSLYNGSEWMYFWSTSKSGFYFGMWRAIRRRAFYPADQPVMILAYKYDPVVCGHMISHSDGVSPVEK